MNDESSSYDKLESMLQGGSSEPHNVPLKYLRNITHNFSYERQLGEGGFGTVYKGVLENGEMIAVKRFKSSVPGVRDRQFENEAKHLMRLKHPNVVPLVGCCSEIEYTYMEYKGKYVWAESSETLLCLEYMPKGNLRGYLSDECSGIGWDTRFKIIMGICYGLRYLHEECQINAPVVHMDLKPANILLDDYMVPKIADFGLSRLFNEEKTWTCTISRDGTLGYMSPEYIKKGLISRKSDIFSLGVIIIETVTGHRDYPDDTGTPSEEFVEMVLHNWSQRKGIKTLFGVSLEVDYQQIRRCIQIGLDCVKTDPSKRPTISQIIKTLHGPESADSSNIKGVHGPQSGERKRNCGTSWMEGLAKKHTPGCSIIKTFTVSLYKWQKKTALRRIRTIFTTVIFVVVLKKLVAAATAADSNADEDMASASALEADADEDVTSASTSASDSDADEDVASASTSASDSDADADTRSVATSRTCSTVPPQPCSRPRSRTEMDRVLDVFRIAVDPVRCRIADALRGHVADALHSRATAVVTYAAIFSFWTAMKVHAGHVASTSMVAHRMAFAAASTAAFWGATTVTLQVQSTATDADVIRVRDMVLDHVLEWFHPLAKGMVDQLMACATVSDTDSDSDSASRLWSRKRSRKW